MYTHSYKTDIILNCDLQKYIFSDKSEHCYIETLNMCIYNIHNILTFNIFKICEIMYKRIDI